MDRAGTLDNVLVMRTLSKLGLAGLRLGFLVGPEVLVGEINKVRLPYNINTLTQASVEFALAHLEWFEDKARAICRARDDVYRAINSMRGITAYPSQANFVLFRLPTGTGSTVFDALCNRGVLVKNLHGAHDALSDCLRVTVSTKEENEAFVSALAGALNDSK
jgi:histidinol-phosphate aminotransferase